MKKIKHDIALHEKLTVKQNETTNQISQKMSLTSIIRIRYICLCCDDDDQETRENPFPFSDNESSANSVTDTQKHHFQKL